MSQLADNAVKIAQSQLGKQEVPKGSNAGPDVEKYLKAVGLGKGYSWCMAFVFWCFEQSAIQLSIGCPLKKTAGVLDQWNSIDAYFKKTVPMPGDVFIMDFGQGKGHTGIVLKVHQWQVETIEGNTNDDGSREGYKVCKRVRDISTIKGFIRV
jgi:hypothetical protein